MGLFLLLSVVGAAAAAVVADAGDAAASAADLAAATSGAAAVDYELLLVPSSQVPAFGSSSISTYAAVWLGGMDVRTQNRGSPGVHEIDTIVLLIE
jgi:hypothetical protein